jgi:hypothetical protein
MGRASPRKVHRYSLEFKRQAFILTLWRPDIGRRPTFSAAIWNSGSEEILFFDP